LTPKMARTSGKRLAWADRYDRDIGDVFRVQDEIARQVVIAIDPAIQVSELERIVRKPPESMVAWDHFLHGYYHLPCLRLGMRRSLSITWAAPSPSTRILPPRMLGWRSRTYTWRRSVRLPMPANPSFLSLPFPKRDGLDASARRTRDGRCRPRCRQRQIMRPSALSGTRRSPTSYGPLGWGNVRPPSRLCPSSWG
jgi:hypothetical protein